MQQNIKICYSWVRFSKAQCVIFCVFSVHVTYLTILKFRMRKFLSYKKKPKKTIQSQVGFSLRWSLAWRVFITNQHWRREEKEKQDSAGEKSRVRTGWPSHREIARKSEPGLYVPTSVSGQMQTPPKGVCTFSQSSSLQMRLPQSS